MKRMEDEENAGGSCQGQLYANLNKKTKLQHPNTPWIKLNMDVQRKIAEFLGWSEPCETVQAVESLIASRLFDCIKLKQSSGVDDLIQKYDDLLGLWFIASGTKSLTEFLNNICCVSRKKKTSRFAKLGVEKGIWTTYSMHGIGLLSSILKADILQQLELEENRLGDECLESLSSSLPSCTHLRALSLRGCQITASGCQSIASGLSNVPLEVLDLSYNRLTESSAESIASIVSSSRKTLLEIHLAYCEIGAEVITRICDELSCEATIPIKSIAVPFNNIGDIGAKAISSLLEDRNISLQSVDVTENKISDDGGAAILLALRGSHLRSLTLSSNRIKGTKTRLALAVTFVGPKVVPRGNLPNLRTLQMSGCSLNDSAAFAVSHFLGSSCCNLLDLDLSHNSFTVEGAQALASAIRRAKMLLKLNLAGARTHSDAFKVLKAAVATCGFTCIL